MIKNFLTGIFCVIGMVGLTAQSWNPFDIENRDRSEIEASYQLTDTLNEVSNTIDSSDPYAIISDTKTESSLAPSLTESHEVKVNYQDTLDFLGNPFEIIRIPDEGDIWTGSSEPSDALGGEKEGFIFVVHMIMLILLGVLMSLYRSFLPSIYKGILNTNYLKLLQRSANEPVRFKLGVFYTFFFLNAGLFIFQSLEKLGYTAWSQPPLQLTYCILGVFAFFGAKHIILKYIAAFFPPRKEATLFSFMIMVFNCMLGILLVPINVLLAFGSDELTRFVFFIGIISIVILFIIKQLKAIFIGAGIWMNNVFHFFLYICAVEIAPICILWKLSQTVG